MSEKDRKMSKENQFQPGPRHRDDRKSTPRDNKSQGIVLDQEGQEQPADKERAQRVHKTKEGQARG
jgi:hypothetical protein